MTNNIYMLYWKDGRIERVEGPNCAEAMNQSGYRLTDSLKLDFYVQNDSVDYEWDVNNKTWVAVKTTWSKPF